MNVGKAAGDLLSPQRPDPWQYRPYGKQNVCVFLVAAADSEVLHLRTAGSAHASTEYPADN